MSKVSVYIVEDDWMIAKEISFMLQDLDFRISGTQDNAEEALPEIRSLMPELVLLDIELAGAKTGIDLARDLQALGIPFLFLTAQSDVAVIEKAKKTKPFAYLVKPVNPENLLAAMEISLFNSREYLSAPSERLSLDDSIFVKSRRRLERVNVRDIKWVESEDIYALLIVDDARYILNQPLKVIEGRLPRNFLRIHRSYIINIDRVSAIEENDVIIDGKYLPIGKTYRETLMKHIEFL